MPTLRCGEIDLTDPSSVEDPNIRFPLVRVYNRGGSLVGSVTGTDVDVLAAAYPRRRRSILVYRFLITYFRFSVGG
jgi:hypothetical protein